MLRHHTGSGRRRVIPADWRSSMGAAVADRMTVATVDLHLEDGGKPYWDASQHRTVTPAGTPIATGVPASIIALTQTSVPATDVVEQQVRVLGYRISIPVSTPITNIDEGIRVTVVTCDDPMLAGSSFHVTDVVRGPLEFSRDLICDLNT